MATVKETWASIPPDANWSPQKKQKEPLPSIEYILETRVLNKLIAHRLK